MFALRDLRRLRIAAGVLALTLLAGIPGPVPAAAAAPSIVVDGRRLDVTPAPAVVDGRVLVPLRAVSEALGAQVAWNGETRTVTITRGAEDVSLRVGLRLACRGDGCARPALLDVPPRIVSERTLVPLRFIAEAFGVRVRWDAATATVRIDSTAAPDPQPRSVSLAGVSAGERVTGTRPLRVEASGQFPEGAEVRFFLLDPETGRGRVVARLAGLGGSAAWLPDPTLNGTRVLAAAVYDARGDFLAGDAVPVQVDVTPDVELQGIEPGQRVTGSVTLQARVNFLATHVRYELVDPATGKVRAIAEADPYAPFSWTPRHTDNGTVQLRAVAFDRAGGAATSATVQVEIAVPRRLSVGGVRGGARVERPVTLSVGANFAVAESRIVLRDPASGAEQELARFNGTGSLRWLPRPDQRGARDLVAVAVDASTGERVESAPVRVELAAGPGIFIETVGPDAVLAGTVKLRSLANVPIRSVSYRLVDPDAGPGVRCSPQCRSSYRTIASADQPGTTVEWRPAAGDAGSWRLEAIATTESGEQLRSESLPVRVHTGKLYGSTAIVPRSRFLDLVRPLALGSRDRTGMSAALQVAQAILESGWGQYIPTDKYSGRVSYNLFGIKGSGTAGSVVSNTWEEYHGVVYRVDARFRAYRSVRESWDDHKRLLLNASRYAPFRAVMHDPVQGAWALRRAGYATDSRYPIKLINLMKEHGLFALDEVAP